MASTQNSTVDFPVSKIDKYLCPFLQLFSLSFPANIFNPKCCLYPWKKASALHKFEMAIKQPTWATFHFKIPSNDNHHRVHREKIPMHDRCQFPTFVPPPKKNCNVSFLAQLPIKIDLGV